MLFEIHHKTTYRYSRSVFLDPHIVRLQPRSDGSQRLEHFNVLVQPAPTGSTQWLDAAGNTCTTVWFDGVHEELTITIDSSVETSRPNPFDFLLSAKNRRLPVTYSSVESRVLAPYLSDHVEPSASGVRSLADEIHERANGRLMPFLSSLCHRLNDTIKVIRREQGPPCSAGETLSKQEGACRDLALVYLQACRAVGLAARFVSGYQAGDTEQERRDLHAWAEVYIPDAGWRGFDPTLGLAVADHHVAVAASADPMDAAPVTGSFRGTAASSEIETELVLTVLPSDVAPNVSVVV